MEAMGAHYRTEHKDELRDNSLSTLLSWSAVHTMGIKTCPLCAFNGPEDAPELVDHVLRHAYDFALRALPWPKPIFHELNGPPGTFRLPDSEGDAERLSSWLDGIKCETDFNPSLSLCRFDSANHSGSMATHYGEYTDYFDTGENCYFDDRSEDQSSRNQKAVQGQLSEAKSMRSNEAERISAEVLDLRREVLGNHHPNKITSMANLASTYLDQGRWEEAEILLVKVVETYTNKLGPDHPDTLTSMANLASTYRNQGRLKEAEKLQLEVMESRKTQLGADHRDTLTSMDDLANTWKLIGRVAEAIPLMQNCVEARQRILGRDHTHTIWSMASLAAIYHAQGQYSK